MAEYFDLFPLTTYNDSLAHNILVRAKFKDLVKKQNFVFLPYTITEGERADQVSYKYYEDSAFQWLVYLSNDIIDPISQWPMDQGTLDRFIAGKYGSTSIAKETVVKYRVAWYEDDRTITSSTYNAFTPNIKKYWDPVVGGSNTKIVGYKRKQVDWENNTNKIIRTTVANGAAFSVGDKLQQMNGIVVGGSGVVEFANTTHVTLKHITGDITANSSLTLTDGTTNTTVSSIISTNYSIPALEASYWQPVYAYDNETEINNRKKEIKLIDKAFTFNVVKELKALLNE